MRAAVFFVSLGFGAIALAGAGFAQDVELPDGPGKDKIMEACTACHAITEITTHRRPKAQWAETMDLMIGRGAQVSDGDYPAVLEYLGTHFAPVEGAAPAAAGTAPARRRHGARPAPVSAGSGRGRYGKAPPAGSARRGLSL